MKNLAIIPARSGSKGLKDKNIKLLNGKPMLAYSIDAAIKSNIFSEVIVSTDSIEYARIAEEYGASVPFLRSDENSSDMAESWDVVREVLKNFEDINKKFDTVCLLQPTSPLRDAEDIINAYEEYVEKKADAITSVCETEHSPLWTMKLPSNNSLNTYRKKNKVSGGRQNLEKFYRLNGAIYIRKVVYGAEGVYILLNNEYAFIMNQNKSVDVDCLQDFLLAEVLLSIKQDK